MERRTSANPSCNEDNYKTHRGNFLRRFGNVASRKRFFFSTFFSADKKESGFGGSPRNRYSQKVSPDRIIQRSSRGCCSIVVEQEIEHTRATAPLFSTLQITFDRISEGLFANAEGLAGPIAAHRHLSNPVPIVLIVETKRVVLRRRGSALHL